VEVSPSYQSGPPGTRLIYEITVANTGNIEDNFALTVSDTENWGPTVSPTLLTVPAGENKGAILSVVVPENAAACIRDNITIVVTSLDDPGVSASKSCVAHAVGLLTEITEVVYPIADVYAFGEYEKGYSRSQLKFDISFIPFGSRIISAELWLYRWAADRWDGNVTLFRVDDQIWGETIGSSEFDAQTLTDGENYGNKFMAPGWDHFDVLNQLKVDYNAGHRYSSFRLRWMNDEGIEPSIGVDDGRFLVVNSELDGISVVFCSSEYDGRDPYLKVTYIPPYAVSASISPTYKSGLAGETLSYNLTVINKGNLEDNYILTVNDNAGWAPTVSPTLLTIPSGENRMAMLSVAILENVIPCTRDNIVVIVTSAGDPTVRASASCLAHRVKAKFSLATIQRVTLDLDLYLSEGSKLVLKFYTYADVYQGENVIWSGAVPTPIVLLENVPHPENKAVENVWLVLIDDQSNVIKIVAKFTVRRSDLLARLSAIDRRWPMASLEERSTLMMESGAIDRQWPKAPG
jgi:hypothetical protein